MLLLADAYLHSLNPFAIRFSQDFGVRWYGLAYAAGFVIGWMLLRWFSRTGRSPLSLTAMGDLMMYVIFGVVVGGRLGYAIFYDQQLFWTFRNSFPFWDLLAINKGGMASHGGMIGVILATAVYARKYRVPIGHVFDLAAFGCPPGLCLGRIANFINAELWGNALPASMQGNPPWWSVKYPQEVIEHWVPVAINPDGPDLDFVRHIALDFRLDATLAEPMLRQLVAQQATARLSALEPLRNVVNSERDFYINIVHAAQQGKAEVIHTLKPLLTAYYPSQIFQAISDGPLLMGLLALIWLMPRKPGVIASWFLFIYGLLRIVTEIYRQPDVGVPLKFGLSQGQLLSVLMMLAGAAGLWLSCRRAHPPMAGLLRRSTT